MFKKIFIFIILMSWWTSSAMSQEICPISKGVELSRFGRMPVLDEGRVKPIDSYARNVLLSFSGRTHYDGQEAVEWLARLLFDPQRTREDQVFLINNPLIAETLNMEVETKRRYSFAQLEEAYPQLRELAQAAQAITPKERNVIETELIRLYQNLQLYSKLSLTFSFAMPHPDFAMTDEGLKTRLQLNPQGEMFGYVDVALRADRLEEMLKELQALPENQWSASAKEGVALTQQLFQWSVFYQDLPFAIVPSYRQRDDQWYSAWDAMPDALTTAEGHREIRLLQNLLYTYWNGEQIAFDLHVQQLMESFKSRRGHVYRHQTQRLSLELIYNQAGPFFWAKAAYLAGFIVLMLSFLFWRAPLIMICRALILGGFAVHFAGLLLRMVILQRPPVSNLYETFLFVGWISVLTGWCIEKFQKRGLGLFTASVSGYVFLMIASKFALEGDTLQMLVAVLNSNFWLSTHVITITIGYAGVCVAGIVGHVYVIQSIFRSKDKMLLAHTYRILMGTLGFGLTMAFLGTNLGGIWADQSWGRFWGWDPKENGALMIILWTALLFHARIAKMIGPLGLAVGSILGIIVVMWAWFGVNLLSVGLHSYGFTSGLAWNLTIYVAAQILFLVIAYPIAARKARS